MNKEELLIRIKKIFSIKISWRSLLVFGVIVVCIIVVAVIKDKYFQPTPEQLMERKIENYSKAIKDNPQNANAYNSRGIAYSSQKEYQKAIADFSEAIKLKPNYAEAYLYRGIAYAQIGNYEQAKKDWEKTVELDPKGPYHGMKARLILHNIEKTDLLKKK